MDRGNEKLEFMKTNHREIYLYYDPESELGKKTKAVALSMTPHVNDQNYHKIKLSTTLWRDLLNKLELRPKDLMNRSHPYYQEHIRGRDFDMDGWLNILIRSPEIIKAPIAMRGDRAILVHTPTDLLKLIDPQQHATAREADMLGTEEEE